MGHGCNRQLSLPETGATRLRKEGAEQSVTCGIGFPVPSTPTPMCKSRFATSRPTAVVLIALFLAVSPAFATDTLLSYWSFNRAYVGGSETAENYEKFSTSSANYGEGYDDGLEHLLSNNGNGPQWLPGSSGPLYSGSDVFISFTGLYGTMFGDAATWQGGWTALKNGGGDAPANTRFAEEPGNYSLAIGQHMSASPSPIENNNRSIMLKLKGTGCSNLRLEYTASNSAVSTSATITWSYSTDGGNTYTAVPNGVHVVPGGGSTHPFVARKDVNNADDPIDLPSAVNGQAVFYLRATFSGFANTHSVRLDNLKLIGTYNSMPNRLITYWSFNNISDNYEYFCTTADGYGEYYDAGTGRLISNSGAGSLWQSGSIAPVFSNAAEVYLDMSNLLGGHFGNRATWTSGWSAFRDGGNWAPQPTGFAPASENFSLVLGNTATTDNNNRFITFKLKSTGYSNLRMAYELADTRDDLTGVTITWKVSTDGTNFVDFPNNVQAVLVGWNATPYPFAPYAVALPASVNNQSAFYLRGTLNGLAAGTHTLRFDNFQLLAASTPIGSLRPGTELFVDDANLQTAVSSFRVFHSGIKTAAPVLRADSPWELNPNIVPPDDAEAAYVAAVRYDAATQTFRMWYNDANSGGMLLATSDNGVVWAKPGQGIYSFNDGSTNWDTNWLMKGKGVLTVYRDEGAVSFERYKALFNAGHMGLWGAYSADGVQWGYYNNPPSHNPPADPVGSPPPFEIIPLTEGGSEVAHVFRDPLTHIYRAYVRPRVPHFSPLVRREGGVLLSHDYMNWTKSRQVLSPDATDDAMAQSLSGLYGEFYSMNAFPYGRHYLGIVPLFLVTSYHTTDLVAGQSAWDGPIEGQFIFSRDGYAWSRLPVVSNSRPAAIPSGAPGTDFDVSIMNVASQPIIVHRADINGSLVDDNVDDRVPQIATDELWHYYHGISTTHGGTFPEKKIAIGVARWRLDGYASLDAGSTEKTVITAPIKDRTGTLKVNADIHSGGSLWVEVLPETGSTAIAGYTMAAALTGDNVAHAVAWSGYGTLPATPYRLRFRFTDASLYSYTIEP